MKVPVRPFTSPTDRPLAYFREADTSQFSNSIRRGLQDVTVAAGLVQQRADQANAFDADLKFLDFESQMDTETDNIKRTVAPNDANFAERAGQTYENRRADFLKSLPPELQQEYAVKTERVVQQRVQHLSDFQFTNQTEFYKQGMTSFMEKAKMGVYQNPDQLETWKGRFDETLNKTDLPPIIKEAIRQQGYKDLELLTFQDTVKKEIQKAPPGSPEFVFNNIIQRESGWKHTWDNGKVKHVEGDGWGIGQVLEKTGPEAAALAGLPWSFDRLVNDPQYNLALAKAYFEYNVRYYGGDVAKGAAAYNGGRGQVDSAIKDYGADWINHVDPRVKAYVEGVTTGSGEGAAVKDIYNDPRFQNVAFEDKLQAADQAYKQAAAEQAQAAAARKDEIATYQNNLFNQLLEKPADGKKLVDDAVKAGYLDDFNDRKKAYDMVAANDKEGMLVNEGVSRTTQGMKPSPESANAMFESPNLGYGGVAGLSQMLPASAENLIRFSKMAQGIPSNAQQVLGTMINNGTAASFKYAMDALVKMQGDVPNVFENMDPKTRSDMQYYKLRWDVGVSADQIYSELRNPTPEIRQAREARIEEADSLIKKGEVKFEDALSTFNPWFGANPSQSAYPIAPAKMRAEWTTYFQDAYVKTGDVEKSKQMATEQLAVDWGPSKANGSGQPILMKYPPEKVYGLPPEELAKQVRAEYKLDPDQPFELLATPQTQSEVNTMRKSGNPNLKPSYAVVTTDKYGNMELAKPPDRPVGTQIQFAEPVKTPQQVELEQAKKQAEVAAFNAQTYFNDVVSPAININPYEPPPLTGADTFAKLHPDIQQEYKDLRDAQKQAEDRVKALQPAEEKQTPQPTNDKRGGQAPSAAVTQIKGEKLIEKGMIARGNIDLYHRPVVHLEDGSIATLMSMSINENGMEILIPRVSNEGKIMTEDEAVDYYHKTGQYLGVFRDPETATAFAKKLSEAQGKLYGGK